MAQMYRVVRVIAGIDGSTLYAGDVVDASQWRNLKALVAAGRLVAVEDEPVAETVAAKPRSKAKAKVVEATETSEVTENVNQ